MTTGMWQNELTLGDCVVQMLGQTLAGIRRCSNCLVATGLRQNELTLGDCVVQMLGQTLAGIKSAGQIELPGMTLCCSDVVADSGRHNDTAVAWRPQVQGRMS